MKKGPPKGGPFHAVQMYCFNIFGDHDPVTVAEQILHFLICQFREKRV